MEHIYHSHSQLLYSLLPKLVLLFFGGVHALSLRSQINTEPVLSWEDFVNEYLTRTASTEEASQVDDEIEWLETLSLHPLQINRSTRDELMALPFLDDAQVDSLLSYRAHKSGIRSLGELQLVSGWDYYSRRYLSLFVRFDSTFVPIDQPHSGNENLSIGKKLFSGRYELESRFDAPLYRRKGYEVPEHPTLTNYFVGNSLHHIVRFRYNYKREIAYGLTLEKDAGEPVLKQGFYPYDYWSGFLMLRPNNKPWSFVVGDYDITDRRGLLFGRDYYAGREQIVRPQSFRSTCFRPHTSGNEYRFFRGIAVGYKKYQWDALLFTSYRKLDARWSQHQDTVRSVQTSGLHRTLSEINRRRTLGVWTLGTHLGWERKRYGCALDGYIVSYAAPIYAEMRTYNAYYFRGKNAGGTALSYYYKSKIFDIQGEVAADHKCHMATEHTLTLRLSSKLTAHTQFRHFSPRFVSIYGNAMQQNGRVSNEQGFLIGLRYCPFSKWELTGYVDIFRFPKPTYRTVLDNAKGIELSLRSRSPLTDCSILNVRYRMKTKQQTITGFKQMEYRHTHRLQVGSLWNWKRFELNVQADATYAMRQTGKQSKGAMLSLRTKLKSLKKIQLKNFIGYHWTDDHDAALYVYEPQLLHAGAFSSFAYHGLRFVVLADYCSWQKMTLSCRFSSTRLLNRKTISSGINEINSPWKNDLSLQFRYIF